MQQFRRKIISKKTYPLSYNGSTKKERVNCNGTFISIQLFLTIMDDNIADDFSSTFTIGETRIGLPTTFQELISQLQPQHSLQKRQ